jgi:SAM-dependent methyltransferase
MDHDGGELYHSRMIDMLQALWGEGFLSPGGPDEVARVIAEHDLRGQSVLDIGCGAGGIDIALVRQHGAGYVFGIDVKDTVLAQARALIDRDGLTARIGVMKVVPGPLALPKCGPQDSERLPLSAGTRGIARLHGPNLRGCEGGRCACGCDGRPGSCRSEYRDLEPDDPGAGHVRTLLDAFACARADCADPEMKEPAAGALACTGPWHDPKGIRGWRRVLLRLRPPVTAMRYRPRRLRHLQACAV